MTLIMGIPKVSSAQNNVLDNPDEVIVVAPYNPNIHPAKALPEWPVKDSSQSQAIPMPYVHSTQARLQAVPVQNIKPIRYKLPRMNDTYYNFAKLGYGTANTPYAEVFLNHGINDTDIGLYVKHLSAAPNIPDAAKANYANTKAHIFAQWGQREWQSALSANFARRMYHYYGFDTKDFPTFLPSHNDSLRQWYVQGGLAWSGTLSNNNNGKWEVAAAYQFFKTHTEGKEHLLEANISYQQALNKTKNNQQYWGIQLETQTNNTNIYNTSTTHGAYQIAPYYLWQFSQWDMRLGARLMLGTDSSSYVAVAPLVQLTYHMPEIGMQIYAKADGKAQPNSLASLSYENPYISPNINLLHTQERLKLSTGIRGHFLDKQFYYDASLNYAKQKNAPLFMIDTTTYFNNAFQVIYDDLDVLSANFNLNYTHRRWDIHNQLVINHYTTKNEDKAWHKPAMQLSSRVYYNVDKWRIGMILHSEAGAPYLSPALESKTLKAWADISLHADFKLNEHLGLFAQVNNILNNHYEMFSQYKMQGFGAIGGLKFAF